MGLTRMKTTKRSRLLSTQLAVAVLQSSHLRKLKQQQKKQAKILEMKEKRRSISSMRRRSLSTASVETNDKVERQSIGEVSLTGDEIKSRQTGVQDDSIPAASDAGVLSSTKISNAPEKLKPTSLEGSNSESWFFSGSLL